MCACIINEILKNWIIDDPFSFRELQRENLCSKLIVAGLVCNRMDGSKYFRSCAALRMEHKRFPAIARQYGSLLTIAFGTGLLCQFLKEAHKFILCHTRNRFNPNSKSDHLFQIIINNTNLSSARPHNEFTRTRELYH